MRRTGNTYRVVLRGLADASEGFYVIVVSNAPEHGRRMMDDLSRNIDGLIRSNDKIEFRFDDCNGTMHIMSERHFGDIRNQMRLFPCSKRRTKVLYDI